MKLRSRLLLLGTLTFVWFTDASASKPGSGESLLQLLKSRSECLKNKNVSGLATISSQMAEFYEDHALWEESAHHYSEARQMQEKLGDRAGLSNSTMHLAYTLLEDGDESGALKYAESAASLYNSQGKRDSAASAYVMMADLHRDLGNYQKAENLILHRALPLYRGAGNSRGRIKCFRSLGDTYIRLKRYSEAKWFYIQQNMQARELHNKSGIIYSLAGLARVKSEINDVDLAMSDLKEAETLARESGNSIELAEVNRTYALVYQKMGDAANAKKYADMAYANRKHSLYLQQHKKETGLEKMRAVKEEIRREETLASVAERNTPLVKNVAEMPAVSPNPAKAASFAVVWIVMTSLMVLYIARTVMVRMKA